MYFDEYGKTNEKTIVMLHGANFVHCFEKQYVLAEQYHIVVPHLMGYGREAEQTFQTDEQIRELADFTASLNQRVILVGFSLGAQLGYRLAAEYPTLFRGAILISPWLCKEPELLKKVTDQNLKQLAMLKKKPFSGFVALMNGMSANERKEFAEQMQKVTEDTVRNAVNNRITIESVKGFEDVQLPILALAGQKESGAVIKSIRRMAELNPYCRYEIWEKAGHDIPLKYADRLNKLIVEKENLWL